ncbi:TrkA C-terminal domain-containing protein [Natrinema salaciae]|uniref:TrkA-C domain-containing protein n=1 Tax=Natrinema salaciae TaxID=1186196 RepID=A0A1H9Q587_9EURY|nr:TrkA C-terminal domain-containing protein [Natrinema salaciae]SER55601.1 TrkA-C domain-containing protein [Natrinema salaciae]
MTASVVVAQLISSETLLNALVGILGFALLAGGAGAGVAFVYRWYSADEIPEGVAVLFGVAMVALWLNTQTALQQAISDETTLTDPATAVSTVGTFAASAIAADAGRRLGDFLARDVFMVATPRTITEVTQLVRAAGRVVTVELPDEIGDVDGYDAVDESVKAELAGQTLLFPRRLTVDELRERLVARLERDFGIGHVDVDLEADGTVAYIAVGSRQAGIGPTLAPGTVAVAFSGDPAADASPGDAVRIWTRDEGATVRIAGGELRATADDVVTVALDADDARDLEPDRDYRLVTLPGSPDSERELVSLLRAADETVTSVSVGPDDPLADVRIDALPVLVVALKRAADAEDHLPLPAGDVRLAAGDVAYVLGRPAALRRVTERTLDRRADPSRAGDRAPAEGGPEGPEGPESDRDPEPERPRER